MMPLGSLAARDMQRLKYVASVHIAVPAARVWALVGHFGDLSWDRAVAKVVAKGGDSNAATRTVVFKSGVVLPDEELVRYEPARFTYATFLPHVNGVAFPVTHYVSMLVVLPQPDGGAVVEWRTAFCAKAPGGAPGQAAAASAAIRAVATLTQPALDGLKARLEAAIPTN
jgi:hypothetical protein